jgi:hypothetical protein
LRPEGAGGDSFGNVLGASYILSNLRWWLAPPGAGAASGFGEHAIAAGALEGIDLEAGLFVAGGGAGIAEQMSRAAAVAEPSDSGGYATLI